ncbi:camp-dependent protein kinase regulatory subunit PkaR [Talaromyces proteolyticus]|uniref:cAMP-dependent protein kinase regulatory subunit n=1 Tax=Talaromyces proteolyticus TaxID=1131652 RepID=A0AAD4Q0A9_9EURO|nr:camp-dependent protein kinase regulatory subunit PkaR [Talaromyces proteolyticus]KAH8697081.1 camp-dependent protein kinase regulatory subunit PkaR [Talaromyces proteolyticus]
MASSNSNSNSNFPGTNPFAAGVASPFAKISEEEEYDGASPTDPNFRSNSGAASSRSPFSSGGGFTSPFQDRDAVNAAGSDPNAHPTGFPPAGTAASQGLPNNYAMGRRTSVSAESLNPTSSGSESWSPPFHPKSADQVARLKKAVSGNFLFSHLDDEHLKTVLDALVEKPIPAKDIKVITQGDAGDYFYIVEEGTFGVFINPTGAAQSGPDGIGNQVGTIGPGGSFGELALMYNAPRAATIVSLESKSTLWALDRITFRRILMDSAFQRRRMYEAFLEEVPLLASLKPYERSKIADALDTIKYPTGETIIREGDPGDSFYLLESGEAEAFKSGTDHAVKAYSRGDYFGELALLDDKPRAASVTAKTDVKVARLGRDGFKRLLGPVEQIMRRTEYDVDPLTKTPAS